MSSRVIKGVMYNSAGDVVDCVFCRIARRDVNEPANVITEDSDYITFIPIQAATKFHLLITPKRHIQNLSELKSAEDTKILKGMLGFARKSLELYNVDPHDAQYCFHVPPYNSIDHLHLHAIGRPKTMDFVTWIKYLPDTVWCKNVATLISELEQRTA